MSMSTAFKSGQLYNVSSRYLEVLNKADSIISTQGTRPFFGCVVNNRNYLIPLTKSSDSVEFVLDYKWETIRVIRDDDGARVSAMMYGSMIPFVASEVIERESAYKTSSDKMVLQDIQLHMRDIEYQANQVYLKVTEDKIDSLGFLKRNVSVDFTKLENAALCFEKKLIAQEQISQGKLIFDRQQITSRPQTLTSGRAMRKMVKR